LKERKLLELSRRERQVMDLIFARGQATAQEIHTALPDAPSYSTVRSILKILEDKRLLRHREQGRRYLYLPTVAPERARRTALRHLMRTFFDDSAEGVVSALLDMSAADLSDEDFDRLTEIVERARREGR
jgi:BlaI family penicillinase repressor